MKILFAMCLSHVWLILEGGRKVCKIWYNYKQKLRSQNKGQLLLVWVEKNPVADTLLIMGSNPATVTEVIVK